MQRNINLVDRQELSSDYSVPEIDVDEAESEPLSFELPNFIFTDPTCLVVKCQLLPYAWFFDGIAMYVCVPAPSSPRKHGRNRREGSSQCLSTSGTCVAFI